MHTANREFEKSGNEPENSDMRTGVEEDLSALTQVINQQIRSTVAARQAINLALFFLPVKVLVSALEAVDTVHWTVYNGQQQTTKRTV